MKAIIKKMSVFVMITAILMFATVAMAWDDHHWYTPIYGKYAFTGSGNCVGSTAGFDQDLKPNEGATVIAIIQIWDGDYTFDGHNSGSFTGTFRAVDLNGYSISIANASWEFKYKMTDYNRFQTYLPQKPGFYDTVVAVTPEGPTNYFNIEGPCDGAVERDGASIKITCAPPQKHIFCIPNSSTGLCDNTPFELLCSESHVGLRVVE